MPINKKKISDYIIVVMGAGLSRFFLFATGVLVARTLGKSLYGQFSLFYVAFSLAPLFPQSFDTTYIRYAKNLSSGEQKEEYLRINILIKIAYFLLIGCLSAPFLGGSINGGDPKGLSPYFLYALGALGGAAQCFSLSLASHFQEQGRFMASTLTENAYCLFIFLGCFILYAYGLMSGLPQVFALYIMGAVVSALVTLRLLLRISGPLQLFSKHQVKSYLYLGIWVFFTAIAMYLFPRLDVMVLARFVPYEDIGIYSAASTIVMLLSLFSRSMNNVLLPKAMKEAIASPEEFRNFSKEVILVSGLVIALALFLFIFAKQIAILVYGPEYAESANIFRVLIIGYLISILYQPYSFIFYALDKAYIRFNLELSRILMAIILLYVMIPKYGLLGSSLAITISMVSNSAISLIILHKKISKYFYSEYKLNISNKIQI